MPRPDKIWYWKARKQWLVTINGRRHKLGSDKEAAKSDFHRPMSQQPTQSAANSLASLLDAFVVYSEEHKAPAAAKWYSWAGLRLTKDRRRSEPASRR